MSGSLPLGVSASAVYEQVNVAMRGGDRVTLLTDGVVEAQNEAAGLLGFARVEDLLRDGVTAAALAETAQHHGQTDDITVLCLQRAAAARVVA
jgi:serine phosphatase RsbU (regulator of sigma subunit)